MNAQTPPVVRSTFVTVVAWIFIVLAGFATLISFLQNIMIAMMFPAAEMEKAANQVATEPNAPWFATFMFNHFQLFFLAFLVVSASALTAAIGLLLRKNWARILFVAIMGMGILWNVAAVVMMFIFVSSFLDIPASAHQHAPPQFDVMFKVMMGFNLLMVLGFCGLFGWIIKKLMSGDIKHEFSMT